MTPQASTPGSAQTRWNAGGDWLVVAILAVQLAWTTLCLGGYLPQTMVVTAWAVFGMAALAGALWVVRRGAEPVIFNRAALVPLPFLLYALASVLWLAPARWLAWREWLLWFQMWLVFVTALHFGRGRRQTQVLVGTVVVLALAGAMMAAYQRYVDRTWLMLGRTQAEQFFGRSAGMFGIPNSLAGLMELIAPACLILAFSRSTRLVVRLFCAWLALLFLLATVLTGSRGGWMGLGVALMLWPLLAGRNWRRKLGGSLVVLVAVMAAGTALYRYSHYAHERLRPFLEGRFEPSRPIIWKAGWRIWRDHWWLGSGAASYNMLFDQYRPKGFWDQPVWAHNDYLNTLSDYGVVGGGLWLLAGGSLFWLGWRAVRRAREKHDPAGSWIETADVRFGLLLGLLAFAVHLTVDFHTKIPALAFLAALAFALLLRNDPGLTKPLKPWIARWCGGGTALVSVIVAWVLAKPLYRAEALRYDHRWAIDTYARKGQGDMDKIIPDAIRSFQRAVKIDPENGQAWCDLSYAETLLLRSRQGNLVVLGKSAEIAADRALAQCPVDAEFWVRKGVALDMQARQGEAAKCFRRALALAPNWGVWWYYYAYHLSALAGRTTDAVRAVETCLSLDPGNTAGIALHQQLMARR